MNWNQVGGSWLWRQHRWWSAGNAAAIKASQMDSIGAWNIDKQKQDVSSGLRFIKQRRAPSLFHRGYQRSIMGRYHGRYLLRHQSSAVHLNRADPLIHSPVMNSNQLHRPDLIGFDWLIDFFSLHLLIVSFWLSLRAGWERVECCADWQRVGSHCGPGRDGNEAN